MQDLKSRVLGDVGSTLMFILAAVACVLLIACANAINLLIARALNRSRELAIRSALGASRGRLIQQLLVETGVLTAGAAIAALGVAVLSIKLVATYSVTYIPRLDEVRLSAPALGWLAALSLLSGLLMFAGGLVPALQSSRLRLDRSLRSGGRSTTDGPAGRQLRRALVAVEFALATPLLVAAALVLASLDRLSRVPIGIDMDRVLTGEVSLASSRYPNDTDRKAFWDRAIPRLAALPGVEAVALADSRPPQEAGQTNNFDLEDRPTPAGENQPLCTWVGVSPGFFRTVGLALERGRLLDDRSTRDNVVVVDRAWADRFFPRQEVIGRRFKEGGCTSCEWTTVVGVVGTVKWTGLEHVDQGTVYFLSDDAPETYFVLRANSHPSALAPELQKAVRELDPELALTNVATGDELMSASLAAPRYLSVLVAIFAVAALVLSVVGIYGMMAYFVQQHTRDIGIRLALGGEPAHVRRMVVLQGLRLVAAGVVLGVGAALLTSRFLTTVLFDISPTNLPTMTGVPLGLVSIAALACLVTGRRAARLDPAEILRES
jgi:predicted permease